MKTVVISSFRPCGVVAINAYFVTTHHSRKNIIYDIISTKEYIYDRTSNVEYACKANIAYFYIS
jgi:hypothetical protein